jgi:NAD(P)-dependent dehydrogenase (short-subunit alcohol dehydrogenase family)
MSTDRKVVVVTGSSQGLGEAFVNAYRDRGWRAVGNARSIAPSDHPDYVTVAGDVGEPAVARRVIETALERFGRVVRGLIVSVAADLPTLDRRFLGASPSDWYRP